MKDKKIFFRNIFILLITTLFFQVKSFSLENDIIIRLIMKSLQLMTWKMK